MHIHQFSHKRILAIILSIALCINYIPSFTIMSHAASDIIYTLDKEQLDSQGIYYALDSSTHTASVGTDLNTGKGNTSQYTGENAGEVIIPDSVLYEGVTYPVTSIASNAFYNNDTIYSISISDNVKTIHPTAFNGSSLTSLSIGKSVQPITEAFLYNTPSLRTINVDAQNPYLCSQDNVLFDHAKTTLIRCAQNKFTDSSHTYTVPDTVTKINPGAFYYCALTDIQLPDSVTTISQHTFYHSKLKSIDLSHVTTVEQYAFFECYNLNWISLKAFSTIDYNAFSGCSSLEALYLPRGINIDSAYSFNCKSLKCIVLQSDLKYTMNPTNDVLGTLPALTTIYFSEDTTRIKKGLLKNAPSLSTIFIPSSVTTMDTDCLAASTTIYGYAGSAAQTYAEKNGNKFIDCSSHTHSLQETVLFENESMCLKGELCKECGYATNTSYQVYPAGDHLTTSASSSPSPSASPSATSSATPSPSPTEAPVTTTDSPVSSPSCTPSAVPATPAPTRNPQITQEQIDTALHSLRLTSKNNKEITLKWDTIPGVSTYTIYRSLKKNSDYNLVKTISVKAAKTTSSHYTDHSMNFGKTYYYQVRCQHADSIQNTVTLHYISKKKTVSGLCTPKIKLKKGVLFGEKYLAIQMKKKEGSYLEIFIKKNQGKYKKLSLRSEKLSNYKNRICLKYTVKNTTLSLKVRTYQKKDGVKMYSYFTEKKIRV